MTKVNEGKVSQFILNLYNFITQSFAATSIIHPKLEESIIGIIGIKKVNYYYKINYNCSLNKSSSFSPLGDNI